MDVLNAPHIQGCAWQLRMLSCLAEDLGSLAGMYLTYYELHKNQY